MTLSKALQREAKQFMVKQLASVIIKRRLQFLTSVSFLSLGNKVVTDVTANNGVWTFLCAQWSSAEGRWAIFQDAVQADEGKGLSKGESIQGPNFCSNK